MIRWLFIFGFVTTLSAQKDAQVKDYIARYKEIAVREMKEHGVPASITIAQGIHESAAGTSVLAKNSNNHFGIKCHKGWEGKTYRHDDDAPQECFRVYENPEESFVDHSLFLKSRKWYAELFDLDIKDYKSWAHGLKKSGYATNPKYAYVLIDLIERFELNKLDEGVNFEQTDTKKRIAETKKEEIEVNEQPKQRTCANEISINNTRAYLISSENSIEKICSCGNITLSQALLFNDASTSHVFKNSEIVYVEPKKTKSDYELFVPEEQMTYRDISQRFGLQLSSLLRYNDDPIKKIADIGERINLKENTKNSSKINLRYHLVEKGDTLYGISSKYSTSVEEIVSLNNLINPSLYIGQRIKVAE